jgi:hypothetical protein
LTYLVALPIDLEKTSSPPGILVTFCITYKGDRTTPKKVFTLSLNDMPTSLVANLLEETPPLSSPLPPPKGFPIFRSNPDVELAKLRWSNPFGQYFKQI